MNQRNVDLAQVFLNSFSHEHDIYLYPENYSQDTKRRSDDHKSHYHTLQHSNRQNRVHMPYSSDNMCSRSSLEYEVNEAVRRDSVHQHVKLVLYAFGSPSPPKLLLHFLPSSSQSTKDDSKLLVQDG
mmetsp:Transcript_5997/g.12185  ORF Transcript_5997/g.12185 Transcript_5997/m.12185 type:complete len:127 (-) Transcript_5997:49-429(-)